MKADGLRLFKWFMAISLIGLAGCAGSSDSVCDQVDCGQNGSCVDVDDQAACLCDPGYVAEGLSCIDDPCSTSPCVHGTCQPDGKNAICDCEPGYTNAHCDACASGYRLEGLACVEGSPCEDDPCVYGVCRSVAGQPECDCFTGYSGSLCDECASGYHPEDLKCVSDTACDPDPCVHGACQQVGGQAVCTCDAGYTGERCEQCASGYHEEGLICVPDLGGPCDPNPCQDAHKSICQVVSDSHICSCDPGYHDESGECIEDTVCNPDPCTAAHQAGCSEDGQGGYTCQCEQGYQDNDGNNTCLENCATAVDQANIDCQVQDCDDSSGTAWCVGGPCDGITCTSHGRCEVQNDQPVCICDSGFQDNDHNNTCSPDCETSELNCGILDCDDSSGEPACVGVRSCKTIVNYDPGGENISVLYIRGEFNDWALTDQFQQNPDGTFTVELDIDPGDYAYKFYEQGQDRWFENPDSLYFKWIDGVRNSRLHVEDCNYPILKLVSTPSATGGNIQFQVLYIDGAQKAGIDLASQQITRNDTALSCDYDLGLFTVDDVGLPAGKYTYRFEVADNDGRKTSLLYVPIWVESSSFVWEDAVLYFVLTDRFSDGLPANNSPVAGVDPKANWQGGDFAGLLAKIEEGYFNGLGVNALWISSISQNTAGAGAGTDGRDYSGYHSYWPISTGWSYENQLSGVQPVDPHFGNLDDFKQLVEAAHQRGIRVLVDLVANHVHSDSPLWQAHQSDNPAWFHDLYVCGWDQPINCWFANYLPDFEYKNLQVMQNVVEHAIWMIQETDVDGFRLDAVKHMIDDFSFTLRARISQSVTTTDQRFYMVGETFTGEGQGSADLIKHYVRPEMLDGQFDFPLYWQILKTFLREEQDFRGLESMLQWNEYYYGDWAVMSNFLGNHDVCRALSHAAGDISDMWGNGSKEQGWTNPPSLPDQLEPFQRLRLAWTFLMTIPGIPLIYYGDEFGIEGAGDPDNRKFMRFDAELNQHQLDTLNHVKKLTAVRHSHRCFRHGARTQLYMEGDGTIWSYGMVEGNDKAVVVFNRNSTSQTRAIPVSGIGLSDGTNMLDVIHSANSQVNGGALSVTLDGHDSAVFVVE
jgi:neopullulanase